MVLMSKPTVPTPSAHHGEKSWTSTWYDSAGRRHVKRLGKVSLVSQRDAISRWKCWLHSEWDEFGKSRGGITVNDLCERYLEHQISEHPGERQYELESALNRFREHFGHRQASEVEAPDIARWRDAQVNPHADPRNRPSHRTIKGRLGCVKRMYRWGRERGLVSREAAIDVSSVTSLRAGSPGLSVRAPVGPVDERVFRETIREMASSVAAMLTVMWHTGCRAGELVIARACDIDCSDKVWVYRPQRHKTTYREQERMIYLGTKAQEAIQPYLGMVGLHEPIFSPHIAYRERNPKADDPCGRRKPGKAWTTHAITRSIHYACERVRRRGGEWMEFPNWNVHQIRHAWATRVRALHGLEAAQATLGHASLDATQIYAEKSAHLAIEIARKMG